MKLRLAIIFLLVATACEPQLSDDPIPLIAFQDLEINLTLPAYSKLRNDGGLLAVGGGVRGIIIYRVNANLFRAFDRNCSYHPNEASSTVDIDASNLFLKDYSCGSQFNRETGQPMSAPAWRPLRQYRTEVIGGTVLRITSDPIE